MTATDPRHSLYRSSELAELVRSRRRLVEQGQPLPIAPHPVVFEPVTAGTPTEV